MTTLTTGRSSWLAGPSVQPVGQEGEEWKAPSKLPREGGASPGGGAGEPAVARGLDRSAYSPRLLERVGDGATEVPLCAPDPVVGPMCHPSQASGCPLFSPHFSSNFVSLERDGSVPLGLLPLIKESWRTARPSPTSSGLSWFIKSTTQGGSRDAGFVVIFHVINKDSFV